MDDNARADDQSKFAAEPKPDDEPGAPVELQRVLLETAKTELDIKRKELEIMSISLPRHRFCRGQPSIFLVTSPKMN
jgi:hypothetical protein